VTNNPDLWEVRDLPHVLALELWGGDNPALVLTEGESRVRVELPHVEGLVATLVDADGLAAWWQWHPTGGGIDALAEALGQGEPQP
jgi:hypothetical protein